MGKIHLTVTGFPMVFGPFPFEAGQILYLRKDPDNPFDAEAIMAHLPYLGIVGQVANTPESIVRGTRSGGRIYDRFGSETVVKVDFIAGNQLICRLLSDKSAKKYLSRFDAYEKELRELDEKMAREDGFPLMARFGHPTHKPIPITPLWRK